MDRRTKIKIENATYRALTIPSLAAIALVMEALSPLAATVRTGVVLNKRKKQKGELTMSDFADAAVFWAQHLAIPVKIVIEGSQEVIQDGKKRLKNYDEALLRKAEAVKWAQERQEMEKERQKIEKRRKEKDAEYEQNVKNATTPAALHATGVDSLITLIENAPNILCLTESISDKDPAIHPFTGEQFLVSGKPVNMDTLRKKFGISQFFIGDIVIADRCAAVYVLTDNDLEHAQKMLDIPTLQSDYVQNAIRKWREDKEAKQKQQKIDKFVSMVNTINQNQKSI